jgi:hypothetical protein
LGELPLSEFRHRHQLPIAKTTSVRLQQARDLERQTIVLMHANEEIPIEGWGAHAVS